MKFQSISAGSPPPDVVKPSAYGAYFKVELSSTTDIEKFLGRSGKGPLSVLARLCPITGEKDAHIIAFGPTHSRKPQTYDIYLVARHPDPNRRYSTTFLATYATYDLAKDKRDVCIRFLVPAFPAAVWSKELRVPAEAFMHGESVE